MLQMTQCSVAVAVPLKTVWCVWCVEGLSSSCGVVGCFTCVQLGGGVACICMDVKYSCQVVSLEALPTAATSWLQVLAWSCSGEDATHASSDT
jgi:hypothetical protein